jgi:hypothetical protein
VAQRAAGTTQALGPLAAHTITENANHAHGISADGAHSHNVTATATTTIT